MAKIIPVRDAKALALSKRGIEVWKPVPGYEGYEASNLGRVRSLDRVVVGGLNSSTATRRLKGRILKQSVLDKWGHLAVPLSTKGSRTTQAAHRIILLTFCGELPKGYETRHLDGDGGNNALFNIEYGTSVQNKDDMLRHGRRNKGSRNGMAVLQETEVMEIKRQLETGAFGIGKKLAEQFNVSPMTISDIRNGRYWNHVGG